MNLSFGTGVNNLSTRQIKESVIPLPPADEQVQIVKIVSSLFTICDRLESSLVDTDELSTKFARSMISAST
jgi:restriction endonuclease S subunit